MTILLFISVLIVACTLIAVFAVMMQEIWSMGHRSRCYLCGRKSEELTNHGQICKHCFTEQGFKNMRERKNED